MKRKKVFINGFGRIGRCAARIILEDAQFELVGVNDIYDILQMKSLFINDSVYGKLEKEIKNIKFFSEIDTEKLNLKELNIDILLQCSGVYLTTLKNEIYIKNGVKKVIISAPSPDNTPTYIYGANHKNYLDEKIISSSSCSATAIVPIFKIINENFGIKSAFLSMTHSYTAYQKLLDVKHYSKDIRRTRSATQNIIPLESSAASAVSRFFPHLNDKLYAKSIRVPVSSVTIYDLSIKLDKKSDKLKMQEILIKEIKNRYKDVLDITSSPLVSTDFIKSPYSATIDMNFTDIVGDNLLRVFAWQDNEYGYAKALVNLAKVIG